MSVVHLLTIKDIACTLTTSDYPSLGATSLHVEKECNVDCREQVLLYIVSSKHSCIGRQLGNPYSAQSPSRRFLEQRVNWDTATDKALHYLCVLHRDETMQQHVASPLLRLIWDKDHPQRVSSMLHVLSGQTYKHCSSHKRA
jgi:hypothetical protein